MQYSALFLSAIAATGAFAAPASSSMKTGVAPMGLRIDLEGRPSVHFNAKHFDSDRELTHQFQHQGPFKKVTLTLGDQVKNQDVRCQLLDAPEGGAPIIMTRGANIDINFSKGDPWTFKKESKVAVLKCGPAFTKTDQATVKDIRVKLINNPEPGTAFFTQDFSETKFEEAKLPQSKAPEGASPNKAFDQVELTVGLAVEKRDLRCQILDSHGMPIIVKRGANIDETFGDAFKGAWTFVNGKSVVSKIECNPEFKKGDASGKVKKPSAGMPADNKAPQDMDMEEQDDMTADNKAPQDMDMGEQDDMTTEPTVIVN